MGEAIRRGSFEERKKEAIKKRVVQKVRVEVGDKFRRLLFDTPEGPKKEKLRELCLAVISGIK